MLQLRQNEIFVGQSLPGCLWVAWRSCGDIGVRVSSFPGPALCHIAAGGRVAASVVFPGRFKVMMCSYFIQTMG